MTDDPETRLPMVVLEDIACQLANIVRELQSLNGNMYHSQTNISGCIASLTTVMRSKQ